MRREQYHVLDGLRGFAAVAVLQRHASELFNGWQLQNSYLAVDLFFLLSGFVLAHAYEARLKRDLSVAGFAAARLLRLYPLYLLGFSAAIALASADFLFFKADFPVSKFIIAVVLGAAFLPAPPLSSGGFLFPLLGPAWSLFFELAINFAYAAIIRSLTTRVLIALVICGFVGLAATSLHYGTLDVGWSVENFPGGFGRVVFSFFAGVLLYRFRPMNLRLLGYASWPSVALLFLVFWIPAPPTMQGYFDCFAVTLIFPCIVWAAATAAPSPASIRLFSFLGTASYAVYVLHVPLLTLLDKAWPKLAGEPVELSGPWIGIVFVMLFIQLSWLLDKYFDAPVRRAISANLFWRSQKPMVDVRPI